MTQRPKTSFYALAFAHKEQDLLERARLVEGLDEDIALARTKTLAAARRIPDDPRLVFQGLDTVARLQTARRRIAGGSEEAFLQAVAGVLRTFEPLLPAQEADLPA